MGLFKKKKSPEECVSEIINRYFNTTRIMRDEDYSKMKKCLEEWNNGDSPDYLGAMAYVKYRQGDLNKMWDYIEMDLALNLGEEEHGAFIPAMMWDVDPKIRYKILKKIHEHTGGLLSLEIMVSLAKEIGKTEEVKTILQEYLMKEPKNKRVKKLLQKLP